MELWFGWDFSVRGTTVCVLLERVNADGSNDFELLAVVSTRSTDKEA